MTANVIDAFCNMVEWSATTVAEHAESNNRMNSRGEGLERFVKDAFVGIAPDEVDVDHVKRHALALSYLGNQNNPPDFMIKGGDAVEVKKLEGKNPSSIPLNSSYPKSQLRADSPMITQACRDAEVWTVKDIVYAVGHLTTDGEVQNLFMVYGDCYAADSEVYERAKRAIKHGVTQSGLEMSETKELGRVKKVDPLGITDLRVRGMWEIQAPRALFARFLPPNSAGGERISVVMSEAKYLSMPETALLRLENLSTFGATKSNIEIPNPDNPASLIKAVLLDWIKF